MVEGARIELARPRPCEGLPGALPAPQYYIQNGASGRARTCDLPIIGRRLYQLSYRCMKLVSKKRRWPRDRFHGGRNAPHNPHTWPRRIATSPWGLRCKIRGLLVKSQALAAVLQPVSRPPLAQWGTLCFWWCRPSKSCSFERPRRNMCAEGSIGVPDGIRTRVLTLKGWRPGPG